MELLVKLLTRIASITGSGDCDLNEHIILFPLSRSKPTLALVRVEMSTTTLKNLISLEEGYVTLYVRYTFYQAM
jgi:hypothetical protein